MALDTYLGAVIVDDRNFGFDSDFILCSNSPQILHDFKQYQQTLVWRNPLPFDVSSYVDALVTEDKYYERMRALHKIPFTAKVLSDGAVTLAEPFEPGDLYVFRRQLNALKAVNGLAPSSVISQMSDIFPEREARSLVQRLEDNARECTLIHRRSGSAITHGFHTIPRHPIVNFHTDLYTATATTFSGPTRIGRAESFEPAKMDGGGNLKYVGPDPIVTVERGDTIIARHPHAEGLAEIIDGKKARARLAIQTNGAFHLDNIS